MLTPGDVEGGGTAEGVELAATILPLDRSEDEELTGDGTVLEGGGVYSYKIFEEIEHAKID